MSHTPRTLIETIASEADIHLNGDRPWDIRVHNEDFYSRVFAQGSLAFGESYMDGWWDCDAIDELICRIFRGQLNKKIRSRQAVYAVVRARMTNLQKRSRAFEVGERHYDIGNDLYEAMLDKQMVYTCGYWKNVTTLDDAQEAKLDLVCRKIGLQPGQRVLDIGCGWGSFAQFAAKRYGAHVTGITVSQKQVDLAQVRCAGLPVEIRLQDYRDLPRSEKYDHVISLGMFEHVGYKNYRHYMAIVQQILKDEGLFLLHTIGGNRSVTTTDPWIDKYIFPNSMLPSVAQIAQAVEGLFVMEDWHGFGADYDKTLMAWYNNVRNKWQTLDSRYSDRFYRMWCFYLLSCAGTFRARKNQLWQVVLSKNGMAGGYTSIR